MLDKYSCFPIICRLLSAPRIQYFGLMYRLESRFNSPRTRLLWEECKGLNLGHLEEKDTRKTGELLSVQRMASCTEKNNLRLFFFYISFERSIVKLVLLMGLRWRIQNFPDRKITALERKGKG